MGMLTKIAIKTEAAVEKLKTQWIVVLISLIVVLLMQFQIYKANRLAEDHANKLIVHEFMIDRYGKQLDQHSDAIQRLAGNK
jgi:uncharacterized membrane protein